MSKQDNQSTAGHGETTSSKPSRLRNIPFMLLVGWATYTLMVIINVSFEALRFAGTTSSEVSDQVFAWFTPAGYVFSIWALIYVVLAIWMVAVTRSVIRYGKDEDSAISAFASTNILNVVWLTLFHLQYIEASVAVIIMLLAATGLLYYSEHRRGAEPMRAVPVSIYFGWISVATVANITHLVARYASFSTPVNEISTVVIALAILIAGYAISRVENDLVYPLVIIWALMGVGVHLLDVSPMTATVIFALTAAGAVVTFAHASNDTLGKIKAKIASV